jgi:membrane protease YdiL (CAAX protease family)
MVIIVLSVTRYFCDIDMKRLVTFFAIAYLISWVLWLPLYAAKLGIVGLPVIPFQHAIGAWGPLLAAFITTFVFDRNRVKQLAGAMVKIDNLWLTIAFFGPFLLAIICLTINEHGKVLPLDISLLARSNEYTEWGFGMIIFYNIVTFGFGEEVGWRGFALPHLQKRYSALVASLILTVLWAVWHWPLFLYRPGYMNMDAPAIFGWVSSLLTGSVLLTWLFNSSKGSILVCAVFHATIDIVFTARYENSNVVNYLGVIITVVGILIAVVYRPANLSKNEKVIYVGDIE